MSRQLELFTRPKNRRSPLPILATLTQNAGWLTWSKISTQ
nr:MAG TPA: hypothetical protein [Caudoviricetes sp.]